MKEENKSSAGAWTAIMVGTILLYLLSPGPIAGYYVRMHKRPGPWYGKVYSPLFVLMIENETVAEVYRAYFKAWGVP